MVGEHLHVTTVVCMCVKIVGALCEGYEVYVYVSAYMGVYASVQTVGT